MKKQKDNRVLGRKGARIMTELETTVVNGGIVSTDTICTLGANHSLDGDLFTGDCIAH
jgi:hypothetical protein